MNHVLAKVLVDLNWEPSKYSDGVTVDHINYTMRLTIRHLFKNANICPLSSTSVRKEAPGFNDYKENMQN